MKHEKLLFNLLAAMLLFPMTALGQSADSSLVQQIQEVQDTWAQAILQKDGSIIERILADEFYSVGWDGKMHSRDDQMGWIRDQSHTYEQVANTVLDVRQYGDIVIVVGEYRAEGAEVDGTPRKRAGSWQTIFTQRDGRWVAIAAHTAQHPAE